MLKIEASPISLGDTYVVNENEMFIGLGASGVNP